MDTNLPITAVKYTDAIYGLEQGVRFFLITGTERALLLDTGFGGPDLPARIAEITDLPLTVALTHGDGDHTGGLKYFDRAFVHAAELPRLGSVAETGIELAPIEEGYVFDLGGIRLRMLHTPGTRPAASACWTRTPGPVLRRHNLRTGRCSSLARGAILRSSPRRWRGWMVSMGSTASTAATLIAPWVARSSASCASAPGGSWRARWREPSQSASSAGTQRRWCTLWARAESFTRSRRRPRRRAAHSRRDGL